jgi:hypothetical protein
VYIFGAAWAVLKRTQEIAFVPVAVVFAVKFGIVAPAQSGAITDGFVMVGQAEGQLTLNVWDTAVVTSGSSRI